MKKYKHVLVAIFILALAFVLQEKGVNAAGTNLALNGTGYRWHGLTSATSNSNKNAAAGINDNNLTTDVVLTGDANADDAVGAYEAAGVIWSSAQTISSVKYINGSWDANSNGVFTGNFGLQFTTNGTTWTNSGWSFTPTYAYDKSSAAKVTYTFTGTATNVLGIRAVGQVHASNNSNSWHANTFEVQAYGATSPTNTPTATNTRQVTFQPPTNTPTFTPSPTPSGSGGFPNHYYVPYIDVSLETDLTNIANTTGSKFFSLAFIIDQGTSCKAVWGGTTNTMSSNFLVSELGNLRAAGGDVVVSFGGAAGNELALDCGSVSGLQAQYQAVINKYNLTHVDFDVEGAAINNTSSIDRRNKAVKNLEAANPNLIVSYTLAVDTTGLPPEDISLLQNAVSNGTRVDAVNIMAMDYGRNLTNLGSAATQAANATKGQLANIFTGKTSSQLWYMIGITPMIGVNDTVPETFTLSNASTLLSFSQQNNIRLIGMWSMNRDHQCPSGTPQPADTCSGVSQSNYQFSTTWKAFNH